ncbi:hypothetical protein [Ruminococcus sp. 5_1_39BFAA]|uniref:hypothetical protein n=1 Tax=Ruminococcus sp. 5_1_39BFAA TaxID=457412 RepID=UPI003562A977
MIGHKIRWLYYSATSKIRWKWIRHITEEAYYKKEHRYACRIVKGYEASADFLANKISEGEPFMAARYGLSEMFVMRSFACKLPDKQEKSLEQLRKWSGFFPATNENGQKFTDLMIESSRLTDYLAVGFQAMEDYFINEYMKKDVFLSEFRSFEPWYGNNPWTQALKGKKVLVIHPFSKTIESQYKKRAYLFPGTDILPEFELHTVTAVQTVAGQLDPRFSSWFEALEYMYDEALKTDFDIALIGCGAYGFPLAAKLKKAGKMAIHMGGMLQVLFGIKGKRWDEDPIVSRYYNDCWVRPGEDEKPKSSNVVEDGCYW